MVLEQEKLDCKENCGYRTSECGSHACGCACSEQDFSFVCCDMYELTNHRSKCAAGCDDRSFCAEWSSSADGDCGGERFKDHHSWLNPALTEQHLLHHFRNS